MKAYDKLYLNDAKKNLAVFFDYAVYDCHLDIQMVQDFFVASEYSKMFERGNPSVLSGMSGIELAQKVISQFKPEFSFPLKTYVVEKTPEYWAGWAVAEYQFATAKQFKSIFSKIPMSKIVCLYHPYHEMDITQFIETMDKLYSEALLETNLKKIRKLNGLSQKELAELSGVKIRSIQLYEQRVNDIDKAQGDTLFKLSRILNCSMEDLLEFV